MSLALPIYILKIETLKLLQYVDHFHKHGNSKNEYGQKLQNSVLHQSPLPKRCAKINSDTQISKSTVEVLDPAHALECKLLLWQLA